MKKYNIVDLFSGAGGLSYGFEMARFNVLLGIDNDEKALETFQKNHQNSEILCGDITNISYEKDIKPIIGEQKVDIIAKQQKLEESFGQLALFEASWCFKSRELDMELNFQDKSFIKVFFNSDGYVLNFSNSTFANFTFIVI